MGYVMQDYQKNRVYRWEALALPNGFDVAFEDIQTYVDIVWDMMNLKFPPKVRALHGNNKHGGEANREGVWFPKTGTCQRIILHELAHSMTMDIEGQGHQHNEYYVGVYMHLLEKFMGVTIFTLLYTAKEYGVNYVIGAKPVIKDGGAAYG